MDNGFRYTVEHFAYYDFCDKDTLCIFDFCDITLDLGMARPLDVYWKSPIGTLSFDNVNPLKEDSDILRMMESMPSNQYMHIYLAEKEYIFSNEDATGEDEFETGDVVDFFQNEDAGEDEFETGDAAEFFENEDVVQSEDAVEVEYANEAGVETENAAHGVQSEDATNVVEEEAEVAFDVEVEVEVENSNEVEDFDSDFVESDGDIAEDEVYEDNAAKRVAQDLMGLNENMIDEVDDTDSDSLHSVHGSDSDSPIWTEFNTECDMENSKFKVGLVFPNEETLKEVLRQYGRKNRYYVKFDINDRRRLRVVCKYGCPWKLWASKTNSETEIFQIKTFNDVHTCPKVMKNKNITSKFLAKTYLHRWQRDRNYSDKLLRQEAEEDFVAIIPQSKCLRAKRYAMGILDGSYKEQFSKMYDYLGELRETNSGIRTICKLDARLFQRVYVCLDACKKGYIAGCRPILSLDGCFLKGHYTSYILTAVGIDANDGIYLIAYVAVEGEKFSSWCWFLLLLQTDLEISNSYHISFMSDRQKGLKEALEEVFPESKQRKYVRHIYNNFKSKEYNKGKTLKDIVWKAARATYVTQYNKVMAEIYTLKLFNITVINLDNENITSFVNPCYYKDTLLSIYGHYISPIRGVNQWTKNQTMEPILPHVLRRPPGRSNKKRRLEADEAHTTEKVSKRGVKMTCTKCGKTGHNIRTCKGVVGGNKYLNKDRQGSRQQHPSRPKLPIKMKHNPPQQSSAQQQSSSQNQPPSITTFRWMMSNSATQESGVSNRLHKTPTQLQLIE
ncbi:hypothetical protein V6N13_072694 [Hibiscus sabdariffa]